MRPARRKRFLDAARHEPEFSAAFHRDRRARMVRQHEDRSVVRRLVAPPAFPAVIRPRPADGTEHVPPENPGTDAARTCAGEIIVDARLTAFQTVHVSPGSRLEKPLHEGETANTDRVLLILVRTRTEPVDGNSNAADAQFGHDGQTARASDVGS